MSPARSASPAAAAATDLLVPPPLGADMAKTSTMVGGATLESSHTTMRPAPSAARVHSRYASGALG